MSMALRKACTMYKYLNTGHGADGTIKVAFPHFLLSSFPHFLLSFLLATSDLCKDANRGVGAGTRG